MLKNAVLRSPVQRRYIQIFHRLNAKKGNYYDVLEVKQDSTDQEIRNAFVKLSKQHHPDLTGKQQSQKFIEINEAYQTLIKPKKRKAYDTNLNYRGHRVESTNSGFQGSGGNEYMHRPWEVKPDINPNASPHYYGVKGLNRVSNLKVALCLIVLCVFGAVFGCVAVQRSYTIHSENLDKKSAEASKHLQHVVAEAKKYGNEEQLKRLSNRLTNKEA